MKNRYWDRQIEKYSYKNNQTKNKKGRKEERRNQKEKENKKHKDRFRDIQTDSEWQTYC